MEIKKEILNNLSKVNVTELDQSVHGRGNYERLSSVITALLEAGFTTSEVEDIVYNKLPINCTDRTLVKRWDKFVKKNSTSSYALLVLRKTFGLNIDPSLLPKKQVNVHNQLYYISLKAQHRKNVSTLKQYLTDNKDVIEHKFTEFCNIYGNKNNVTTLKEFFEIMFPDEDFNQGIYLLACNLNNTKSVYFNNAIYDTTWQDYPLKDYTHFCLNRPYIKMKAPNEGVCETDILNARYLLIEVDEGLTLDEQILLGKLMVIKGLPVKSITKSGGKSIHIILDLRIYIIDRLTELGRTSGLLKLRNYCNTSPKQYINGYTEEELTEYFKCTNMNDYYKETIKQIYDTLYSIGIHPDYACKNLNRWTRIPNGVRNDGKYNAVQECIYLRPTKYAYANETLFNVLKKHAEGKINKSEGTLSDVRKFTSDLLADYDAAFDKLNEL